MPKLKVAFVVQRYGTDFAGGAESLTMRLAEGMRSDWDVTVLTTCAKDYRSWENDYPEGNDLIGGVNVIRFKNDKVRDLAEFSKFRYDPLLISAREEKWFFEEQGPHCPNLISYIRDNRDSFDAFIFVTYLYYQTIYGVSEAPGKAYLISTAHDEPPFHLKRTLGPIFAAIKGLIYLSDAELYLIERFYKLGDKCSKIKAGYGVEIPSLTKTPSFAAVREKFAVQISTGYFLYLGRASVTKLCQDMFTAFRDFKTATGSKVKLLLGGSLDIELPGPGSDVEFLGFLSEDEKSFLLSNTIALVNPSATESLSIVIQESWAHKRPVIINGDSDVMLEFCLGSGGGVHYHSPEVFSACFEILAENAALANEMGLAGLSYVEEHCTWDVYRQALLTGVK